MDRGRQKRASTRNSRRRPGRRRRPDGPERHQGHRGSHGRRPPPPHRRPGGHRRRQRGRPGRQCPRHSGGQCPRRQQHQRRRARLRPDARARPFRAGRRPGHEGRQVGEEALPRHRAPREDARNRRPRADRPGGRPPGAPVRDAPGGARSLHLDAGRRVDGRGAAVARRPLRDRGLRHAPHAVDAADQAPVQRRTVRDVQAGDPPDQHGPRRTD